MANSIIAVIIILGLALNKGIQRTPGQKFSRQEQANAVIVQRKAWHDAQLTPESGVAAKSVATEGMGKLKCSGCPYAGACSRCIASVHGDAKGWASLDNLPDFDFSGAISNQ